MKNLGLLAMVMLMVSQMSFARTYACWAQANFGGFDNISEGGSSNTQFRHTSAAAVSGMDYEHTGHVGIGVDRDEASKAAISECQLAHASRDKKGRIKNLGACFITDCVGER